MRRPWRTFFQCSFSFACARNSSALAAGAGVDNCVRLADLTILERRHLKEALIIIKQIQNGIRAAWQLDRFA